MNPLDFITTDKVAHLLGMAPATFLDKRARLIRDHGFPQPMPFIQRPLRWRADRVLAWLEEQGLPRATEAALPPRPTGPNVVLMEEARRL
jgi:predicted DNA-binding transcriptional regulator AlpA